MDTPAPQPIAVESPPAKRFPAWLAVSVAALFFLCIGGLIYWFLGGSFGNTSAFIPDPNRAQQSDRHNWRKQANADGVHPLDNNAGFFVRSGPAFMDILNPNDKSKSINYRFRFDSQALLPPDQWHLVFGVRRIFGDTKMAETLDVTKDQLDHLRKFTQVTMDLSKSDRNNLIAAWEAYDKAGAKADPEKKLVALLKDASTRALPSTKTHTIERVTEISKLFTPDQIRELTKLGAGQPITPLHKPTTAP
ncbi:MAG TPA: hypothetical protein VFE58_10685 [Tepidisphaeraceae bacterium]|jgi:hypothetical protein|nr:hypothetical protein [Tepidisphaeraceae bacterium]